MNKHTVIIITGFLVALVTLFFNNALSNYILIALAICMVSYSIFTLLEFSKRKFEADFVLRKQRQSIRPWFVILAVISVIAYFTNNKSGFLTPFLLMIVAIAEILTSYIIKNKKPVTLVITGSKIKFNDSWGKERNIENLEGIYLNGLNDEIHFSFRDQKSFYLKRSNYNLPDIDSLIQMLKLKSKMQVIVSDNLKIESPGIITEFN